jgi:hypothetical protein
MTVVSDLDPISLEGGKHCVLALRPSAGRCVDAKSIYAAQKPPTLLVSVRHRLVGVAQATLMSAFRLCGRA